jgi:hypothetical protein
MLRKAGVIARMPTPWQIELGVLRMWHRLLFRPQSVGTCVQHPVRRGWRPWLLRFRLIRLPFLVWERAIAPFDHSGLGHGSERLINHLLTAHHDENQFVYDLEILSADPTALQTLHDRVSRVLGSPSARTRWLRDLCVFENYHEDLLAATRRAMAGELQLSPSEEVDPDIRFSAYIGWCLAQPPAPAPTWAAWRSGHFPAVIIP